MAQEIIRYPGSDSAQNGFKKCNANFTELMVPATNITYDDDDRVSTYVKNGVTYTCTYYTEGNGSGSLATVTGAGVTRTYTYNSDGLLTDEVIT